MEALSVDIERKVKALVDAGYYSNKSEVITNAVKLIPREYGAKRHCSDRTLQERGGILE